MDSKELEREILRRKTFSIISHPDAGKTTLTEKFLLYGGLIQAAGAIKAKKGRAHAVSDWMEMEKERGISIASSVLQFPYKNKLLSLVDTPGHADFSEDTYRALMATDAAIMLLDAAKGVETQTKKLFRVCKMRKIPIFTFVNKLDRPGREPFDLIGEVEDVLGIGVYPITWPILAGNRFLGVLSHPASRGRVFLFELVAHGAEMAPMEAMSLDAPHLEEAIEPEGLRQLPRGRRAPRRGGRRRSTRRSSPSGEGDADVLRERDHQFRSAAAARLVRRAHAEAGAAPERQGADRARGRAAHRVRLQDPGEHGPRSPGSRRVLRDVCSVPLQSAG